MRQAAAHRAEALPEGYIAAAGTAHCQQIPVLRVTIYHILRISKNLRRQCFCPGHATFLIHGNHSTQRSVARQMLHDVHDNRNAHAIISPQAGSVSMEEIALTHQLYFIRQGIEIYPLCRHTDHIHVSLQHSQRLSLTVLCRFHIRNDIIYIILHHAAAHIRK